MNDDPAVEPVPRGWHSRGYLPHFDSPEVIQHVTFRLADSLPGAVVGRLLAEIDGLDPELRDVETHRRLEGLADAGHGACWLRREECARIVQDALLHFDGERYHLMAWVVMPNHVHALFQTLPGWATGTVVVRGRHSRAMRLGGSWGRRVNRCRRYGVRTIGTATFGTMVTLCRRWITFITTR